MLLGVATGTTGAWSVTVRSACAQSAAESGELLLSAVSALEIWASSRGSQNSDRFALPVESGTKDWQAKSSWIIREADRYDGLNELRAACAPVRESVVFLDPLRLRCSACAAKPRRVGHVAALVRP